MDASKILILFVIFIGVVGIWWLSDRIERFRRGKRRGNFLFVWCMSKDMTNTDFVCVIDANSASAGYGQIVSTVPIGVGGTMPHHAEYLLSRKGEWFANGYMAGTSWRFDLNDPLNPKLLNKLETLPYGYKFPHTFYRLKNGRVLNTIQYNSNIGDSGESGAIVEYTQDGKIVKIGNAFDPNHPNAIFRPYGITVLYRFGLIIVTSFAMDMEKPGTNAIQVFNLRTLKLLRSILLEEGPMNMPFEIVTSVDGRGVIVNTGGCRLLYITDFLKRVPIVKRIYSLGAEDGECAVIKRINNFLFIPVQKSQSIVVLDVSDSERPVFLSRYNFSLIPRGNDTMPYQPHMLAFDFDNFQPRIAVTDFIDMHTATGIVYMLNFNETTGELFLDRNFSNWEYPGVNLSIISQWPHDPIGSMNNDLKASGGAIGHGIVFSNN